MLGSILSAAASLGGKLFEGKQQEKFAKNSLSWKARDAERAGISKVFAMGAPTVSYSPVGVGDSFSGLGSAIDKGIKGQSAGGGTTSGKISGVSAAIAQAQLEGIKIDNDIKRADLASKVAIGTQPGTGGVLPDTDVVPGPEGVKLKKEIPPAGGSPFKSFGVSPEVDLYRTHSGYAPQYPQQLQEAFENDWIGRMQWNLRNRIMPGWDMDAYGAMPKKAGSFWMYNPITGQYVEFPERPGRAPRDVKEMYNRLRR